MATRLSTALVNKMMAEGSFKDALANAVIDIYSGTQPASGDAAATGTLLVSVTKSSAAFTNETKAVGMVTLAGASGSVNTLTVAGIDILGGAVAYAGSLNATATAVALAINNSPTNKLVVASSTGASAVVTITAKNGMGAKLNGLTVAGTGTTLTVTATDGLFGSGTGGNVTGVASTNGITFGPAALGVLVKNVAETWSGTAANTGTAGWFRVRGSNDAGGLDSTYLYPRYDGSISTTGAQMNLGSLAITAAAPFILSSAEFSLPVA